MSPTSTTANNPLEKKMKLYERNRIKPSALIEYLCRNFGNLSPMHRVVRLCESIVTHWDCREVFQGEPDEDSDDSEEDQDDGEEGESKPSKSELALMLFEQYWDQISNPHALVSELLRKFKELFHCDLTRSKKTMNTQANLCMVLSVLSRKFPDQLADCQTVLRHLRKVLRFRSIKPSKYYAIAASYVVITVDKLGKSSRENCAKLCQEKIDLYLDNFADRQLVSSVNDHQVDYRLQQVANYARWTVVNVFGKFSSQEEQEISSSSSPIDETGGLENGDKKNNLKRKLSNNPANNNTASPIINQKEKRPRQEEILISDDDGGGNSFENGKISTNSPSCKRTEPVKGENYLRNNNTNRNSMSKASDQTKINNNNNNHNPKVSNSSPGKPPKPKEPCLLSLTVRGSATIVSSDQLTVTTKAVRQLVANEGGYPSIRSTLGTETPPCGTTCYYYEATVISAGQCQIGWALDQCEAFTQLAAGVGMAVGDCTRSIGVNSRTGSVKHCNGHVAFFPLFKTGDVFGASVELMGARRSAVFTFYMNGQPVISGLRSASIDAGLASSGPSGLYPAASLMVGYEMPYSAVLRPELRFNFGSSPSEPFRYPLLGVPFRDMSGNIHHYRHGNHQGTN